MISLLPFSHDDLLIHSSVFFYFFIVIQLQLSAFSPHPSTPPQPIPPPSLYAFSSLIFSSVCPTKTPGHSHYLPQLRKRRNISILHTQGNVLRSKLFSCLCSFRLSTQNGKKYHSVISDTQPLQFSATCPQANTNCPCKAFHLFLLFINSLSISNYVMAI